MMDVSLDTDITIHLYNAGKEELLFKYFDKCYVHEFILEREIKYKSQDVYKQVKSEIESGKIILVTQKYLIDIKMKRYFENKRDEIEVLFDFGEANAIALASTLGIAALVTDDTKEFGPHDTLVKELVEDIIPFSFYELLFLDYLQSDDDFDGLQESFEWINRIAYPQHPMSFISRISRVVRRFNKNGTERDRRWIENFCSSREIDYKSRMKKLLHHLREM